MKAGRRDRSRAHREGAGPQAKPISGRTVLDRPWLVGLFLGVVAVGFCVLFFNPLLSTIGDNAQYVVLGKSLLAGKGLCHINAPDRKPDTKYPFLFPLILAGVMWVAPGSVVALKLVCGVACVGAAVLYYPVFRNSTPASVALGAAVLSVLSPDILRHSTIILAEVPYLFASFAVLAWIGAAEGRWGERRWVPVALLLVMVAYYLKTVGVALAAAVFLWLLLRRKVAWAFGFLGGFVLLALPWTIRSHRVAAGGTYFDYLFMKDPYRPYAGVVSAGDLVSRLVGNVGAYFRSIVPTSLAPFAAGGKTPALELLLWVASLLTAAGLIHRLWRRRTVMDLYLVFFLAICALWPRVWASVRFIVPVIPLLFLCFLGGLWAVLGPLERRGRGRAREAVFIGLVILAVIALAAHDRVEAGVDREYTDDWKSYFDAARWVKTNTPPESVVISRKPYLFYLVSERRSLGYRFSTDPEEVLAGLEEAGATHVVVDQFYWTGTTAQYLVPVILAHPERFPVLYATERRPQTYVLQILPSAGEEGP